MAATLLAAEAAADVAVTWQRCGDHRAAAAAERRAAVLAAAGRSNKEIAESLFLSVRTVEGRLQRVYEKFGVTGRAELSEALG